ncbi:MAG: hypothetical protein ACK5KT_16715 [Dysgonomonas sp.]
MCEVKFTPISLMRKGDRFHVELDMCFVCESVDDNASHMFTPTLINGDHRIELPLMLVIGKCRYRALKLALWGLRRNVLQCYKIKKTLKAVNRTSLNYMYRVSLDYEGWMDRAKINLSIN